MRKVLSLMLSIVMVLGTVSTVFATGTTSETITVYLSISDNGEFVTSPVTNEKMANIPMEISYFDLADYGLEEYYRYEADSFENGGAYINTTVVETPTLMHLFIKAMEDYYLNATYDATENGDVLKFTGASASAYADKFWAHDSNLTYLVNNKMPEMKAGWGASCDYILLEDGMNIEVGMFSSWDWAYSGTVASFENKEMTAYAGGSVNFSVKGNPIYYGGSEAVDLGSDKVFVVKSSQLDWVNDETAEYIFETDENGVFNVWFDSPGEFFVSAVDINVGSEEATIAPAVCKVTVVEAEPLPDYTGDWTSFRGNENNMGVVSAKIPRTEKRAELKWAQKFTSSWMDSTTSPVVVNENLYFAKNDKVLCVSTNDGSIIAESESLAGSIGYGTTSITYGGGLFYVPIGSGRIQALRADTLESVWISESLGGQAITPITYHDGKIYCGTYINEESEGTYFCLDTTDQDKNQKTEEKVCLWTITHMGGFYWAGAYATDDYVVFGSDDGSAEGVSGTSILYSVNPESGEIVDTIEGIKGDIRSTVAYDSDTDRVYFTTKGGSFCKVKVNDDGTFDDGAFETFDLGGASTVTPLVYDGLAYIGVSGSAQFENGGHGYKVIDVNAMPMKEVASMAVPGYVQSSGLLTNAYENNGRVYVYITYNNIPGGIFELEVSKSDEVDEDGAAVVELSSAEIFVPEGDMAQYCICSPVCDENGVIYYKNDSGYLMAIERKASGSVSVSTSSGASGDSDGGSSSGTGSEEESPDGETSKEERKENVGVQTEENLTDGRNETEEMPEVLIFEDTIGHWAEEYIGKLVEKGITKGKTETEFAPEDNVTRAEFVTLLYRLSGEVSGFEESFEDVKADEWYSEAISWAVKNSITSGTSEKTFSPNEKVTREQTVVFIARYLEKANVILKSEGAAEFVDADEISDWAKEAVAIAKNAGIITGKNDGRFCPKDGATRAEIAKILANLMGLIEGE